MKTIFEAAILVALLLGSAAYVLFGQDVDGDEDWDFGDYEHRVDEAAAQTRSADDHPRE